MFKKPFYLQETREESLWRNAAIIFGSLILVAVAMYLICYILMSAAFAGLGIGA